MEMTKDKTFLFHHAKNFLKLHEKNSTHLINEKIIEIKLEKHSNIVKY